MSKHVIKVRTHAVTEFTRYYLIEAESADDAEEAYFAGDVGEEFDPKDEECLSFDNYSIRAIDSADEEWAQLPMSWRNQGEN